MKRKLGRISVWVPAIALALSVSALPAAGADQKLLDILLANGAITGEQHEQLVSRDAARSAAEEARMAAEIRSAVEDNTPAWLDRFQTNADFRLRWDWQHYNMAAGPDQVDRHRPRIRGRFGFTYDVNDYTQLGVQLATGGDSPITTNQSLDDRFGSKSIVLDLFYVKQGFLEDRLIFLGGKFKNPFANTSFLTFDPDLRFEGAAGQLHHDSGAFMNVGGFPLDELKGETDDPWMFGVQGGYEFELSDAVKGTVAVAYYTYTEVDSISEEEYESNTEDSFDVINPNLTVDILDVLPVYVGLQFDYLHNVGAGHDEQGYLVGTKVGEKKIKDWKDWQLFATYSRLEANAQYDEFPDSDFRSGGTNVRGWTVGYKFGLGKRWEHDIKYYNAREVDGPKDKEQRIQADLKYKF